MVAWSPCKILFVMPRLSPEKLEYAYGKTKTTRIGRVCKANATPEWFVRLYDGAHTVGNVKMECDLIINQPRPVMMVYLNEALYNEKYQTRIKSFCENVDLPEVLNKLIFSFIIPFPLRFIY